MTKQEVFTKVAKHLLKQGKRAEGPDGCQYFAGRRRCAVGCLIPNEYRHFKEKWSSPVSGMEYTQSIEDFSIGRLMERKLLPGCNVRQLNILSQLQEVHDVSPPSEWREDLSEIAKAHKLKMEV